VAHSGQGLLKFCGQFVYVCDRSECRDNAMLGKQVGGAGNAGTFRFRNII
jgi:hypothetical protein